MGAVGSTVGEVCSIVTQMVQQESPAQNQPWARTGGQLTTIGLCVVELNFCIVDPGLGLIRDPPERTCGVAGRTRHQPEGLASLVNSKVDDLCHRVIRLRHPDLKIRSVLI